MAVFNVDPIIVKEKAGMLEQQAGEFELISNQLIKAATTMGSAYESADNKSFVTQMEECAKDLKAMANKLLSNAQTIKTQAQMYIQQEVSNTQQANKLHV